MTAGDVTVAGNYPWLGIISYDDFETQVNSIVNDPGVVGAFRRRLRQSIRWFEMRYDFPYMRKEVAVATGIPVRDKRFSRAALVESELTGRLTYDVSGPVKRIVSFYHVPFQKGGEIVGDPAIVNPTAQAYAEGEIHAIPYDRINWQLYKQVAELQTDAPRYYCHMGYETAQINHNTLGEPDITGKTQLRWNNYLLFPMKNPSAFLPESVKCGYMLSYRFTSSDYPFFYDPLWNTFGDSEQIRVDSFLHYPIALEEAEFFTRLSPSRELLGPAIYNSWTTHWQLDNINAALEADVIMRMTGPTREPELYRYYRDVLDKEIDVLDATYGKDAEIEDTIDRMQYVGQEDVDLAPADQDPYYPFGGR